MSERNYRPFEDELGEVSFWMGEEGTGFDGFVRWNHNCVNSEGKRFRCNSAIPVDVENPRHWDLISSEPISVMPSILCTTCQCHGYITDGKWISV